MKRLSVLLAFVFLLSGCTAKSRFNTHLKSVPPVYHQEFKERYGDSKKDEAYYGAQAINFMAFADDEGVQNSIRKEILTPRYFLNYLKSTQKWIKDIHGFYLGIWSRAIDANIESERRHITFPEALYTARQEAENLGLNRLLKEMKDNCAGYFLNSNIYQVQYMTQLYSTYLQSIDIALDPTGISYNEYKEKTKTLYGQFNNLFYKAEASLHHALSQ